MTFAYADNIDTDGIIAGKYTKSLDAHEWPQHVFEDLDPDFKNQVQIGDVVVAGWNFGCGSSREQAPVAIKLAGVSVVIARTFARIFFRNATNIGLPLLEIRDHDIDTGDELEIDLKMGSVLNKTKQKNYQAAAMPQVMIDILAEGGLVPYLKKYGNYQI
jgi:3-isopropylmalate/(R)-2-methylmalate dehydratase small subunit